MACAAGLRHERARNLGRPSQLSSVPTAVVGRGPVPRRDIATPIRAVFRDDARLRVLRGTVAAVDVAARRVIVDGRAVGTTRSCSRPALRIELFRPRGMGGTRAGAENRSDATSIRSRILDAFEQAEATGDPVLRERALDLPDLWRGTDPGGMAGGNPRSSPATGWPRTFAISIRPRRASCWCRLGRGGVLIQRAALGLCPGFT